VPPSARRAVLVTEVHVSATADYALRAVLGLAACYPASRTVEALAAEHGLPRRYLEVILAELRRAGVVHAHRGREGGYALARDPAGVTLGDILAGLRKPFADLRGARADAPGRGTSAPELPTVWRAAARALDGVLDDVCLTEILPALSRAPSEELAGTRAEATAGQGFSQASAPAASRRTLAGSRPAARSASDTVSSTPRTLARRAIHNGSSGSAAPE
jgi:Rrf2 family protein